MSVTKLVNNLYNISNDRCVLVEFPNESDENNHTLMQVGFSDWLHEDFSLVKSFVKNNEELTMSWPTNADIHPASSTYILSLKHKTFRQVVVKVLACGTWLQCKEKMHNIERYDKSTPTKSDRSQLKKINDEAYIFDLKKVKKEGLKIKNCQEINVSLDRFKKRTDLLKEINNTFKKPRLNLPSDDSSIDKVNKLRIDMSEKNTMRENNLKEVEMEEYINIENEEILDSREEENEEKDQGISRSVESFEEFVDHSSLSENADNVENNEALLTEKGSDNFDKMTQELNFLKENLAELNTANELLKKENEDYKEKIESLQKIIKVYQKSYHQSSLISDLAKIKGLADKCLNNIEASSVQRIGEPNDNSTDKSEVDINNGFLQESNEFTPPVQTDKGKFPLDPTEFVITESMLKHVRKNTVREFTIDILDRLFTREELAASSVTGKASNAHKDKIVRPALDPERLNAARIDVQERIMKFNLKKGKYGNKVDHCIHIN